MFVSAGVVNRTRSRQFGGLWRADRMFHIWRPAGARKVSVVGVFSCTVVLHSYLTLSGAAVRHEPPGRPGTLVMVVKV